jgi:hypothetical protein
LKHRPALSPPHLPLSPSPLNRRYHRVQTFNATANQATSSLLFLSCIGIIIPTASTTLAVGGSGMPLPDWNLQISRGTAVVLLAIYCCYLVFQLHSHCDLFAPDGDADEEPTLTLATSVAALTVITACVAACSEWVAWPWRLRGRPLLPLLAAIFVLHPPPPTLCVRRRCNQPPHSLRFLSGTIKDFSQQTGLSQAFVGFVSIDP